MKFFSTTSIIVLFTLAGHSLLAQCQSWVGIPRQEEAEEAHVLYRQFLKAENYDEAFKHWQKAYELAPAADGQRAFHYSDGRTFHMRFFESEPDPAKKAEHAKMILKLYDEQMQCYQDHELLNGLKVYDMFYKLRSPYPEVLAVIKGAIEKSGNNTSYLILEPYGYVMSYMFKNKQISLEEAQAAHIAINDIASYNIANNANYGAYYQQAIDRTAPVLAEVEGDLFDCQFFKNKFEPEFRADPENLDHLKYYYATMLKEECDPNDPLLLEIKAKYETLASAYNAEVLAKYYLENPGAHAKALFDEGKYEEAISKYEEAVSKEQAKGDTANIEQIASYNLSISSILFRQLDRYSSARDYALKAARQRPNWGQPYITIGDMYAATSSSCGAESWDHQLAVLAAIDKYAYARSIDDAAAEEANKKIARYSGFKPDKEQGFMRGVTEGTRVKVPCWIGETVTVRY